MKIFSDRLSSEQKGDTQKDFARKISSDINKIQFSIDLLRAFKISEILGIAGTCIFGVAWSVQLCRNRRLVKKGGDQRHQIEHNDPYNKRSGLDSYGVAKEDKGV
jgi:hypothetical protein